MSAAPEPLELLLRSLLDSAVGVILGVGLGVFAAHALRSQRLHWSWALIALALLFLTHPRLGGYGLLVLLAALSATVAGFRREREDIQLGGDLAAAAAQHYRPRDAFSAGLRALTGAAVGVGEIPRAEGELVVGDDARGRPVAIPFGADGEGMHTLVVGATGSGKTVTQTALAVNAIARGMGVVVVDPKDDRGLHEALRDAAAGAGRKFLAWTPTGPTVYNPFAHGEASELADKALAGEHFTEPHYLRQAQRYLGRVVGALHAAGVQLSLQTLVAHLDPVVLEGLACDLPEAAGRGLQEYLRSLSPRQRSDLTGVRDRLAILAESDLAPWLDPRTPAAEVLDLLRAVRERAVVYFALQADRRPLLVQMLGAAIVQDLQTTVAALQGEPTPTLVVLDEFSALAAQQVTRLFGRARSAGMSLVLGTQELSDLRASAGAEILDQILGNLSTLIAHRQLAPDSAELIARLAGTTGAWTGTLTSEGQVTRRRVREYRLQPDTIQSLPRGCAAVLVPAGAARVRIARMRVPVPAPATQAR